MQDNNRLFFNQILERRLTGLCLWEDFDDKDKRKIYEITGSLLRKKGREHFEVWYFKERRTSYKTTEDMIQDYVATSQDLIDLGKSLAK